MTTTTPGRRLHAALLAHGIETIPWDEFHPMMQRDFDRAARAYDESGDLRDRLDALTAEVAALRRDRDADLHAMEEARDRLARLEAADARLARCEGRDGEIFDRLGNLEKSAAATERHADRLDVRCDAILGRVKALEARQIDGGDPLRRTG